MPMPRRHVLIPVCTISILWNFLTNPYQFSETTSGNNRVTAPVKPQETTNYELQGTGWATRAPVAQTLQSVRQTCSCTTATWLCTFARFPSCGIFTPTRTSPVKQRVETTGWRCRWNTQERQITSCINRGGQHARPSHKHCKACAKHAHAP